MGISAQSFVENRTRSGGEVLIRGEVQPRQRRAGAFEYRYIGVQQLTTVDAVRKLRSILPASLKCSAQIALTMNFGVSNA